MSPSIESCQGRSLLSFFRHTLLIAGVLLALVLPAARAKAQGQPAAQPAQTASTAAGAGEQVNRIILRVNGRILTLFDYLQRRAEARADLSRAELPEEEKQRLMAELPQRVMRAQFQEMLVLSRADQLEVFISQEELDKEIAERNKRIGFQSEDEFQAALEDMGLSLDQYRRQIETRMVMNEVIGREVQSQIQLENDDLRRFYRENPDLFITPEQRRTQEIVVLDASGLGTSEMTSLAHEIYQRLQAGESLAELAAEYSAKGQTSNVIDLEWVERGDLDPTLEAVLWDLEPGQFSQPVVARGGLHILQLEEIKESSKQPFSEVRDAIYSREAERLFDERLFKYFEELAQTAYIVEHLPEDAVGYRRVSTQPFIDEPFKIRGESEGAPPLPASAPEDSDSSR